MTNDLVNIRPTGLRKSDMLSSLAGRVRACNDGAAIVRTTNVIGACAPYIACFKEEGFRSQSPVEDSDSEDEHRG